MRKTRAARNRTIRTNGLVSGHKFVERKVYNITMDDSGYAAVVALGDTLYRVIKPKHAKSWSPVCPV